MRQRLPGFRTIGLPGAIAAAAGAVVLAAPGTAFGANSHGPKIDDRVAAAAAMTSSTTAIPVIVFGNQSAKQDPSLHDGFDLGLATAGTVPAGRLDAIAADPNVVYVAPDLAVAPLARPGDKAWTAQSTDLKSLYTIVDDAPAAWNAGYAGSGIGIAVLDSGVDSGPLGSRLVVRTGARSGQDQLGHGTLVASFAAGNVNGQYVGIAPQANVIDVAVGRARDGGVYTSDVVAGLEWVLANKDQLNIRVVNLSLMETTPSSYTNSVLDTVVEQLWRAGIVVVTAAGNAGPGTEAFAPANDPFAITVGATDSNGTADPSDDVVTPWSSSGPTLDGIPKPDLVAPGRLVTGYLPEGTFLAQQAPAQNWVDKHVVAISGTSFSAPQAAGAAADVLQAHPSWTPDEVKAALESSARSQAGSTAPALDAGAAVALQDTPAPANQGIRYAAFGTGSWIDALLQGMNGMAGWNGMNGMAGWNGMNGMAGWNGMNGMAGWNGMNGMAGWNLSGWNGFGWS